MMAILLLSSAGLVSNAKLTIDDTTHMDIACSVMGSPISCKKEQYSYDGKTTITLPTINNATDCLGSMISEFGGDPSSVSVTYDPKGDAVTVNAMGFAVPLTHAACKKEEGLDAVPPNRATCAKLASQTTCDANANCTWCKCAAVPSSCFDLEDAKRLPAGVFICDKKKQPIAVEEKTS